MPKILAEDGDWLRRGVDALVDGGCGRVLVTVGAARPPLPRSAQAVAVPDWRQGLASSVRAGLTRAQQFSDSVGVLMHVVDAPGVNAVVVAEVLRVAGPTPKALVRATYRGVPRHPVYLGADHLSAVMARLTGDQGAGRFLAGRPDVTTIGCDALADGRDRDIR